MLIWLLLPFSRNELLVTVSIPGSFALNVKGYDLPELYKYLDYAYVMSYDYHAVWDKDPSGLNAPLYSRPGETGSEKLENVNHTLVSLIKRGALPKKTVLGVPLFGHGFSLVNPEENEIGSKVKETSFKVRNWYTFQK